MNRAVHDCLVAGYENLVEKLTLPDQDDRHILAAAIRAKADFILTLNTRDFPKTALAPYGIVARQPDEFVLNLFEHESEAICRVARAQRAALSSPPQSVAEFLDTLRTVGLKKTATRLAARGDEL
jgi:hypothetical protein